MTDFDRLMSHLREARAIAASLVGTMSEADELHEMLNDAVEFAKHNCWLLLQPTVQERREARYEEIRRERALEESVRHLINGR